MSKRPCLINVQETSKAREESMGVEDKEKGKNQRPRVFKRGDGRETHEDKARYKEIPSPEREA